LNGKIQAIQDAPRAQNQLQQRIYEAEQTVATAKGQAEANRLLSQSNPADLIRWQLLMIQRDAVAKWNGVLPTYTGGRDGSVPLITLPNPPPER
jgi:prohibitin 2